IGSHPETGERHPQSPSRWKTLPRKTLSVKRSLPEPPGETPYVPSADEAAGSLSALPPPA
ncbi:MAG TPA: hypothetical protein VGK73_13630, partial [Polyangiaceae bacterium]